MYKINILSLYNMTSNYILQFFHYVITYYCRVMIIQIVEAADVELPCRMCPWFDVCDAMDEYVDDVMDYDDMDEDICDD